MWDIIEIKNLKALSEEIKSGLNDVLTESEIQAILKLSKTGSVVDNLVNRVIVPPKWNNDKMVRKNQLN